MAALRSHNNTTLWNGSSVEQNRTSNLNDVDVPADGSPTLRILISTVYSVVCAAGLLGNLLVFFLMKARRGRRKRPSINQFILNLAVTDFQFVLTLPFWAVDIALDFSWPFGNAMCKIILTVTVMNMYASVFFLTAMSVTRYWSVASALKDRTRQRVCPVHWVIPGLWLCAMTASLPTAVFSTIIDNINWPNDDDIDEDIVSLEDHCLIMSFLRRFIESAARHWRVSWLPVEGG